MDSCSCGRHATRMNIQEQIRERMRGTRTAGTYRDPFSGFPSWVVVCILHFFRRYDLNRLLEDSHKDVHPWPESCGLPKVGGDVVVSNRPKYLTDELLHHKRFHTLLRRAPRQAPPNVSALIVSTVTAAAAELAALKRSERVCLPETTEDVSTDPAAPESTRPPSCHAHLVRLWQICFAAPGQHKAALNANLWKQRTRSASQVSVRQPTLPSFAALRPT